MNINKKNIIKEELGISQIVNSETNELIDYLNDILSNTKNYTFFNWDDNHKVYGTSIKRQITLFNEYNIDLYFSIAVFNSYDNLMEFNQNADTPTHYGFSEEDNAIVIRCNIYKENFKYNIDTIQLGEKNTSLRSTLSHELKHAYQFFKKNKTPFFNDRTSALYNNSIKLNKEQKGIPSLIGYYIYYTNNIEITANLQALWMTINQDADNYNKALEIYNNSELVETTKIISFIIQKIKNNTIPQEQINTVQNYLNISINKVISLLESGNKKLIKACGRIRQMIENNYKNNNINENVIKLSHCELRQIIRESIRKIINEI